MTNTIVGIGNCQVRAIIDCAAAALNLTARYIRPDNPALDDARHSELLGDAKLVFAQIAWAPILREYISKSDKPKRPVINTPRLFFPGFHPDNITPLKTAGKLPHLPMGNANSAILLAAWSQGLGPEEAISLFRDEVYEALGYYRVFESATEQLIQQCANVGIDAGPMIDEWERPFFYVPLHPKMAVSNDVALALLHRHKIASVTCDPPAYDQLATNVIWPVYPEIGERLGVKGDYIFRPNQSSPEGDASPMNLEQFIQRTYEGYRRCPPDLSHFPRLSDPRYQSISSFVNQRARYDFGSDDWLEADTAEAMKVICDEELLDPRTD